MLPVLWSLLPVLVVGGLAIMSPSRERSQALPQPHVEVTVASGIVYGEANREALRLDIYQPPARETPRPAVILIFGGAWRSGDRTQMADPARHLAEAGYVAFSIDHRLLNDGADTRWPAQLDDAQRAVRWVRAHATDYGVDPERVCSYGWSSGAHLAAMLGVRETRDNRDPTLADYSSRVACVVALSGDLDLTVPQPDRVAIDLLGGTLEEQPEAYRDASPLFWVDAETAPFLIVHGGLHDTYLAEQSQRMAAALYAAGVEVVSVAIPEIDHEGSNDWVRTGPLILAFLELQLHPAA